MVLGDIPIPGSEYEAYLGSAISRDPSPPIQSHTNTLARLTPPIAKPRPCSYNPSSTQHPAPRTDVISHASDNTVSQLSYNTTAHTVRVLFQLLPAPSLTFSRLVTSYTNTYTTTHVCNFFKYYITYIMYCLVRCMLAF